MIHFIKMAKQANIFKYFGNVTATRNVAIKEKEKEREINNSIQNLLRDLVKRVVNEETKGKKNNRFCVLGSKMNFISA